MGSVIACTAADYMREKVGLAFTPRSGISVITASAWEARGPKRRRPLQVSPLKVSIGLRGKTLEGEITVLRARAKELQGELEEARKRIRRSQRERERYARDLEWFNDQLASRDDELAAARKRLATLSQELAEHREHRTPLLAAHQRWARAARHIEDSPSWRVGSFVIRAFRRLTFRPGPSGGPAELAASIESFDSDRAEANAT